MLVNAEKCSSILGVFIARGGWGWGGIVALCSGHLGKESAQGVS